MAATPTPGNLFDEFEEAFQNCLAPLIKEDHFNAVNQDELKTTSELSGQRFLDIARQLESFFLQKRYLLSIQKPELILLEDTTEMRAELARKDELLKKHADKLNEWQSLLSSMQSRLGTSPSVGPRPSGSSPASVNSSGGVGGGSSSVGAAGGGSSGGGPAAGGGSSGGGPAAGGGGSGGGGGGGGGGSAGGGGGGSSGSSGPPSVGSHGSVPMPGLSPVGGSMVPTSMSSSGPPQMSHSMNPGMSMSQPSMMQMGGGGRGSMGPGSGMGSIGGMNQGGYQGGPGDAMFPGNMGQHPPPPGGLQGPLAFLEKTTTNIGMPEPRR